MKKLRVLSACGVALLILITWAPSTAAPRDASVAIVWRVAAPNSSDPGIQAVEAGIIALNGVSPQVNALAAHPGARATLAIDPLFLVALEQLAARNSVLNDLAGGKLSATDVRAVDLLDTLSSVLVVDRQLLQTPAGKRFSAHASAARLALTGNHAARFSTRDDVDFAGIAVLLAMVANGYGRDQTSLLTKNNLDERDLRAVGDAFAAAARDVLSKAKLAARNGSLELAALPAYEPILPLVVDAAGRTRQAQFTVNVGGREDAAAAIEEGMRAITALSGEPNPGIISPHGAYDDATAAVIQEHHPSYAIFSDRVVKANTGASAQAVSETGAAALRGYLMETSKTNKLPILFCSDTASTALDILPASSSADALGDRVRTIANEALNAATTAGGTNATTLVLCLDLQSPILRRPDRQQILGHLDAVLSGSGVEATTPTEFLRHHPPTTETYGFEPASDSGGFALWMGSANQASLWTALSDARKQAGGDGALARAPVRTALLRAESSRWFMALAKPQPREVLQRSLTQFRSAIAEIYRAASLPVPAGLAPVKWEAPATIATPSPAKR